MSEMRNPPNDSSALDPKDVIAARVAEEIMPGMLVNLGIGLPSRVANFMAGAEDVFFQAENGVIGLGARPPEGMEDPFLTDAGGGFVSAVPGAASRLTHAATSRTGQCPEKWCRAWAARWIWSRARGVSSSR